MFFTETIYSQTITFVDSELKQYLLNENCIDTNNDGYPDTNADMNNDNEIQVSEALTVLNLQIGQLNNPYNITSIEDLNNFSNLQVLKVYYNDYLIEIQNLYLNQLHTLMIDSQINLEHIDISTLTQLNDLRIEGCLNLNYMNIQNGSVANYFSLFYTENIQYACVDDIPEEYDEVLYHMASGNFPSTNCALSINENFKDEQIILFPNPTNGQLSFKSKNEIIEFEVFNSLGQIVLKENISSNIIDISELKDGIYFLKLKINEFEFIDKTIIKE
jgi:hypothetical protein